MCQAFDAEFWFTVRMEQSKREQDLKEKKKLKKKRKKVKR